MITDADRDAAEKFALKSGYTATYDRMRLYEGYLAGLEAERTRALVLVEALKYYATQDYYDGGSYTVEGDVAQDALAEWEQK